MKFPTKLDSLINIQPSNLNFFGSFDSILPLSSCSKYLILLNELIRHQI